MFFESFAAAMARLVDLAAEPSAFTLCTTCILHAPCHCTTPEFHLNNASNSSAPVFQTWIQMD